MQPQTGHGDEVYLTALRNFSRRMAQDWPALVAKKSNTRNGVIETFTHVTILGTRAP
jgi:hypothetical protein